MIRRAGLLVLLALLVLVAGTTFVVVALIGEAADDNERREAEAFAQVRCAAVGVSAAGDVVVDVTADNTDATSADYFVEFELLGGSGALLGDGFANLTDVPAGERLTQRGFSAADAPGGSVTGVGCRVTDVDRRAAR